MQGSKRYDDKWVNRKTINDHDTNYSTQLLQVYTAILWVDLLWHFFFREGVKQDFSACIHNCSVHGGIGSEGEQAEEMELERGYVQNKRMRNEGENK